MTRRSFWVVALGCCLSSISAFADVNPLNGNFGLSATDFTLPQGPGLEISRAYNSNSRTTGIFGPNWGASFESSIEFVGDGSLILHEYGGGRSTVFTPIGASTHLVDAVVEAATAAAIVSGPVQKKNYRERLLSDFTFRSQQVKTLARMGKLSAAQPANGTVFQASEGGTTLIHRNGEYIRELTDGRSEIYASTGALAKIVDASGNWLEFRYQSGRVTQIDDSFGRKLFLKYTDHGLLTRIDSMGAPQATYSYNSRHELVETRSSAGKQTYRYDPNGNHQLAQVVFPNQAVEKIEYHPDGRVKRVIEPGALESNYAYGPDRPGYAMVVLHSTQHGIEVENTKTEYFFKTKADGTPWTERVLKSTREGTEETFYDERCDTPKKIKLAGQEGTIAYDSACRPVSRSTAEGTLTMEYPSSATIRWPSKITFSGQSTDWFKFQYDSRGNLVFAEDSQNHKLKAVFDGKGLLRALATPTQQLEFVAYDENMRPAQIKDPAVGVIAIHYARDGKVLKRETVAGKDFRYESSPSYHLFQEFLKAREMGQID